MDDTCRRGKYCASVVVLLAQDEQGGRMNNEAVPDTKLTLGDQVRDTITGVEGTLTCYCVYLTGSTRLQIERKGDGKTFWFDAERLSPV